MPISAINRVRYAAWAWLAAALLVGLAIGGAVTAGLLLPQLRAAQGALARYQLLVSLGAGAAPALHPGEEALANPNVAREEPPPVAPATASKPLVQPAVTPPTDTLQAVETPRRAVAAVKVAPAPATVTRTAARPAAQQASMPASAAPPDEAQKIAASRAKEAQRARVSAQAPATPEEPPPKASPAAAGDAGAPATAAASAKSSAPSNYGPTQRVTKEEAGLADVEAEGVTFKSGRRVAVGDSFPSGERLVSVDPAIGEIITTKRRIVLKTGGAAPQPQ